MQSDVPRLEVRNLTRRFDGLAAVEDLSLSISPGQVTCLLGPSGCGKSTALRLIAGVERQDSGSIWVDGAMISGPGRNQPPEVRGIGLMFQDFALFPHLTVAENVAFGLNGPGKAAQVANMLDRVDLAGHGRRYPHQLSGGEQQRVALARALVPGPGIMLMDEPFSGLDDRLRDGVRDATLDILKDTGAAVLLVTHEPTEAMRVADEIALMRGGTIIQTGAPYTIYSNPVDLKAAAFFSDVNVLTARVNGALCDTPFGQFLVPGVADGCDVAIAIRPQHVGVDFDRGGKGPNPTLATGTPARGLVERARFIGRESLVEFRMDHDGSTMKATVPSVFLPEAGRPLWLTIRRDRCFVFGQ